jgi:hypothetical protein
MPSRMTAPRFSGRFTVPVSFIIPRRNNMYDTLVVTALENAFLNDGDLTLELEDQLRRTSMLDIDAPLDLSSLYHTSDLDNLFV